MANQVNNIINLHSTLEKQSLTAKNFFDMEKN